MKFIKSNILVIGLVSMLSFTGCSDFLDETSQDEIIPETVDDLSAVMYSEAYPYQFEGNIYLRMLTDEVVCNGLNMETYSTNYEYGRQIFNYNTTMFDGDYTIPSDANSWVMIYEKIMGCNVVNDYIDKIDATETEKNAIKGQVLFLRGFYYLKLAIIYCQPYTREGYNPADVLGLPLVTTMNVTDDFPVRSSLEDTYAQIEGDLKEAVSLLKANYEQPNKFRVGYLTAEAMLTRFYIFKNSEDDLQSIIDYSNDVLSNASALTYLSSFESTFHDDGIYNLDVSSEPLWVYGTSTVTPSENIYFPLNPYSVKAPYSIAPELLALYDANDLRADCYFKIGSTASGTYMLNTNKIGTTSSSYGDRGIRNAEVYLNRAEAYCRLFINTGNAEYRINALSDLNSLRETRYATGTYEDEDITDGTELLNFCLEERRRELCMEEGLRWADIKRLNLSVDHVFIDEDGNEATYTLSSGDLLYALPIPYNVINRNSKLAQNPR